MSLSIRSHRMQPSLRLTLMGVAVIHLVVLGIALGNVWWSERVKENPSRRIIVHTVVAPVPARAALAPQVISTQELVAVQETPPPPPVSQETIQEPVKPVDSPVKKVQSEAKQPAKAPKVQTVKKEKEVKKDKPEPKKEVEKKPAETKPVESKKTAPTIDQKTLKALQQELQDARSLDKELPVITAAPKLAERPQLTQAAVSGLSGVAEEDYISQLKQHLQNSLRLPDVGEITIGLRLTAQGRVVGMEILKKTSALNEKYVLEQVPQMIFPAWGRGVEEKYFPLTLRSK